MQYEYLFWSMAAVVAAALAGGAVRPAGIVIKRTLIGVAALAVAIFVAVLVLSRLNGFRIWRRCCPSPPLCSDW